jgi:hypothetical protein
MRFIKILDKTIKSTAATVSLGTTAAAAAIKSTRLSSISSINSSSSSNIANLNYNEKKAQLKRIENKYATHVAFQPTQQPSQERSLDVGGGRMAKKFKLDSCINRDIKIDNKISQKHNDVNIDASMIELKRLDLENIFERLSASFDEIVAPLSLLSSFEESKLPLGEEKSFKSAKLKLNLNSTYENNNDDSPSSLCSSPSSFVYKPIENAECNSIGLSGETFNRLHAQASSTTAPGQDSSSKSSIASEEGYFSNQYSSSSPSSSSSTTLKNEKQQHQQHSSSKANPSASISRTPMSMSTLKPCHRTFSTPELQDVTLDYIDNNLSFLDAINNKTMIDDFNGYYESYVNDVDGDDEDDYQIDYRNKFPINYVPNYSLNRSLYNLKDYASSNQHNYEEIDELVANKSNNELSFLKAETSSNYQDDFNAINELKNDLIDCLDEIETLNVSERHRTKQIHLSKHQQHQPDSDTTSTKCSTLFVQLKKPAPTALSRLSRTFNSSMSSLQQSSNRCSENKIESSINFKSSSSLNTVACERLESCNHPDQKLVKKPSIKTQLLPMQPKIKMIQSKFQEVTLQHLPQLKISRTEKIRSKTDQTNSSLNSNNSCDADSLDSKCRPPTPKINVKELIFKFEKNQMN